MALFLASAALAGCQSSQETAEEHAMRAVALLDQNRFGEARLEIADAIQAANDQPRYYLLRARIEMRANAAESAFAAYQDALALDGTNGEALLGVGQLGLQLGYLSEAEKATSRMLTLDPNQQNALLVAGLIAFVKKRYDDATDYADRLLAQSSTNEGGTILWVRTKFIQGKAEEAKAALRKFEEIAGVTPGSARTRLEIARHERDAEAMDKAFRDLKAGPQETIATKIDEANFRFKRGQPAEALALSTQVLEAKEAGPADIRAVIGLWQEYDVGTPPQAVLQSLQTKAPTGARQMVAAYLIDAADPAAGEAMLTGLTTVESNALRAQIALSRGQMARAREQASALLAKERTQCTALIVHARASLDMGKTAAALRSGQVAAAECPNLIGGWVVTAQSYSAQGSKFNARRIFRDGLAANPQSTPMARAYVDWLIGQDAGREAVAAARRLTNVAPALSSGWELYSQVCHKLSPDCVAEAVQGLEKSRTIYGRDMKPGEKPENSLFGRFVMR